MRRKINSGEEPVYGPLSLVQRALAALFSLIIVIFASTQASADTSFRPYPYGAPGDAGATQHCLEGSFIVGVHASKGAWINKLGLVCAKLSPYARVFFPETNLPMYGSRPGGDADRVYRCGPNEVVVGIVVTATESKKQVVSVLLDCVAIEGQFRPYFVDGPIGAGAPNTRKFLGLNVIGGELFNQQSCGPGEAAYALAFRYGQDVNALGLVCKHFAATTPDPHAGYGPPPPAPGPVMSNASRPIKVTGRPSNPSPARPALPTAQVLLASTVYKSASGSNQPDNAACAVRPGDVVTVDSTGPDKWAHLANIQNSLCNGQPGWVWNDGVLQMR